jgi:hypothetical protein
MVSDQKTVDLIGYLLRGNRAHLFLVIPWEATIPRYLADASGEDPEIRLVRGPGQRTFHKAMMQIAWIATPQRLAKSNATIVEVPEVPSKPIRPPFPVSQDIRQVLKGWGEYW